MFFFRSPFHIFAFYPVSSSSFSFLYKFFSVVVVVAVLFSCVIILNLIRFTCTGFNGNLSVFYSDAAIYSCVSIRVRYNR